jgi:MFS family permease
MGGGGINVLVNVIIVDLVPQVERAKFSGIISLAGALGLAAGMLCGAALAQENWRW